MNTETLTQTPTLPISGAQPRILYGKVSKIAYRAMRALQDAVDGSALEPSLIELVKLRASLLNGCAFCIDLHYRDARKTGENEERLYLVSVWEEAGALYTPREQAALRWTDALTRLGGGHGVSDEIFEDVRSQFTDEELVNLTLAIVAINGWNRFSVGFKVPPRFGG